MKQQKGYKMKKMLHLLAAFVAICVIGGTVRAAENVAQIGETKYETLDAAMLAAFTSASDVTVTVLSDGDYSLDPLQYFFSMIDQKTVTLNLNGANVTMKADMMILYGNKLVVTGDGP